EGEAEREEEKEDENAANGEGAEHDEGEQEAAGSPAEEGTPSGQEEAPAEAAEGPGDAPSPVDGETKAEDEKDAGEQEGENGESEAASKKSDTKSPEEEDDQEAAYSRDEFEEDDGGETERAGSDEDGEDGEGGGEEERRQARRPRRQRQLSAAEDEGRKGAGEERKRRRGDGKREGWGGGCGHSGCWKDGRTTDGSAVTLHNGNGRRCVTLERRNRPHVVGRVSRTCGRTRAFERRRGRDVCIGVGCARRPSGSAGAPACGPGRRAALCLQAAAPATRAPSSPPPPSRRPCSTACATAAGAEAAADPRRARQRARAGEAAGGRAPARGASARHASLRGPLHLPRVRESAERRMVPRLQSHDDLEKLQAALRRARLNNVINDVPDNPVLCTHGTHRCHHAAHAYTGVPCAAYITKGQHPHTRRGGAGGAGGRASSDPAGGFLPRIDLGSAGPGRSLRYVDPARPVTLELSHGRDKQVISLPTDKLDRNKRYYVTFTIKGGGGSAGTGRKDPLKKDSGKGDADEDQPAPQKGLRHHHAESL
ncbi:Uncharacterized protein GBIM_17887, partial [Gryllus bimaculatus]